MLSIGFPRLSILDRSNIHDTIQMKIQYTPYRGKIEPILDIRKAEVTLHPEHIEVIYSYDFQKYSESGSYKESMNAAYLIPKYGTGISRSASSHSMDETEEEVPMVTIESPCYDSVWLRCKTNKEADKLYLTLRKYLLE
jgi:hypothetical protein